MSLTPSGRRAAASVASARAAVLCDALDVLSPDERVLLEALTSRVVVGLMREPGRPGGCAACATRASAA